MENNPNTLFDRWLERLCDPQLFEGIRGDLDELYTLDLETHGTHRTKWLHLLRLIGFFRLIFLNKSKSQFWQKLSLLKSYLTTSWRVGWRNKTTASINLMGLTLGATACIFLAQYIFHEWSYERHLSNHDQTYRLVIDMEFGDGLVELAITPTGLAHKVHSELSQVANHTILRRYSHFHFQKGNELVPIKRMYKTDPNLNKIFDYHWVAGDPDDALKNPYSLVVTETTAKRLFGDVYALGQTITSDDGANYTVTGIIKDPPFTSHIHPQAFVSMTDPAEQLSMDAWRWAAYIQLKDGVNADSFQPQLDQLANEIFTETGHNGRGKIWVKMQPLTDIHFISKRKFELEPNDGNYLYLKGFIVLLLLILLMSIVNFINLSTAQASQRIKEIHVRKTFGAFGGDIKWQFLIETSMYLLLALLISALLVVVLQPQFREFSGITSSFEFSMQLALYVASIIITLIILTGTYPARYIAKLATNQNLNSNRFRSFLVLVQLTLCTLVIISTTVIFLQIHYMNNQELGFKKEQVLFVNLDQSDRDQYWKLADALLQLPDVSSVAATHQLPGDTPPVNNFHYISRGEEQKLVCPHIYVNHSFFNTLKIEFSAGRNFNEYREQEVNGLIVNEKFVKDAGWSPQEAIGKTLKSGTRFEDKIIGVVKDFHFNSLHTPIEPLVIRHASGGQFMLIRISDNELRATLEAISSTWKNTVHTSQLDFGFLDQNFQQQYVKDQKRADFFAGTSCLIIFISLAGLFGLSTYSAQKRIKEMSIRKVHGANHCHMLKLMSGQFFRLSLIAMLLAIPTAYYILTHWLEHFAYAIQLSWWMFWLPAILLLLLVVAISSLKSLEVVRVNPAKILRNE